MRVVHLFRGHHAYLAKLINSEVEDAEVHVVVSRRDVPLLKALKPSVHVHYTEMPRVRSPLNAVRLPALWSLFREIKPDILHLQSGVVWEYALALVQRRCPVIMTVHDVRNHPSWGGRFWTPEFVNAYGMKSVDGLIVHGNACRDLLLKLYSHRIDSSRVYSVDHGVIDCFGRGAARSEVPQGGGHVLFFGHIDKYKGLEYLMEAEPILRSLVPGVSIIVAGDTTHPDYYRNLAKGASSVTMRLGFQDDESVERLFRWADVVVLPYIEASQSGVLQVAVAFGVPPVVSKVGGLPDVISDRVNGVLVEPRDPLALATAIQELLTNRELRDRVIGNLQIDREGRFSWSRIAARTLDIYREVIARF
jgi:glycosyltransferase involved in cell wall biosynthesis